jgi:hypothetical protein
MKTKGEAGKVYKKIELQPVPHNILFTIGKAATIAVTPLIHLAGQCLLRNSLARIKELF